MLSAAAEEWPHIHISDSLVMADAAVKMAEAGCEAVAVLGVDFMSENVRAILDEAGHTAVKVGGRAGRRGERRRDGSCWRGGAAAGRLLPCFGPHSRGTVGVGKRCACLTAGSCAPWAGSWCPCSPPQPPVSRPLPAPPPRSQVYRMSADAIGCSLAEAAESAAYDRYLSEVGGSCVAPCLGGLCCCLALLHAAGCCRADRRQPLLLCG